MHNTWSDRCSKPCGATCGDPGASAAFLALARMGRTRLDLPPGRNWAGSVPGVLGRGRRGVAEQ
jgi:hypothetical protein